MNVMIVLFIFSVDRTPPVVACPLDQTFEVAFGNTGRQVTWNLPTVTDNSGSFFLVSNTNNPNDVFQVGTNQVTYTYSDAANNENSCSFRVIIVQGSAFLFECFLFSSVQLCVRFSCFAS